MLLRVMCNVATLTVLVSCLFSPKKLHDHFAITKDFHSKFHCSLTVMAITSTVFLLLKRNKLVCITVGLP